jgi:hypothetical protein
MQPTNRILIALAGSANAERTINKAHHQTLITLRHFDDAALLGRLKGLVRVAVPLPAILLPVAFLLSNLSAYAHEPNVLIYLAYVGATVLVGGLVLSGVGLVRASRS